MTVAVLAAAAVGAHLLLASSARRRGRRWPWWRTASWTAGVVAVAVALGPVAGAAHADFRAHMLGHLLLGMLGPLLLVLSAPVTLLLRATTCHGIGAGNRASRWGARRSGNVSLDRCRGSSVTLGWSSGR